MVVVLLNLTRQGLGAPLVVFTAFFFANTTHSKLYHIGAYYTCDELIRPLPYPNEKDIRAYVYMDLVYGANTMAMASMVV